MSINEIKFLLLSWKHYQFKSSIIWNVKHLSTMRETWFRSLGWGDPLEKEMAIYSRTIAWKIPWTEEPGRLQSMGSQRVGHDWATSLHFTSLRDPDLGCVIRFSRWDWHSACALGLTRLRWSWGPCPTSMWVSPGLVGLDDGRPVV